MDLTDVDLLPHATKEEYTPLSSTYAFIQIDHGMGQNQFNKLKRIEIILSLLNDHSGMKLEKHYRKLAEILKILSNETTHSKVTWLKETISEIF